MSLPIQNLRKRLQDLIKYSKRGYMAALSSLSGVPDATIYRIAYGKQTTVTYNVWKKLSDADEKLPPPPSFQIDDTAEKTLENNEGLFFATALQNYYTNDHKFKKPEDLADSVGVKVEAIKSLLKGDYAKMPNLQEQKNIASAFGLSLKDFNYEGKNILGKGKPGYRNLEALSKTYDIESVTTTNPDIIQIVVMLEKLSPDACIIVKDLILKLLIAQINDERSDAN